MTLELQLKSGSFPGAGHWLLRGPCGLAWGARPRLSRRIVKSVSLFALLLLGSLGEVSVTSARGQAAMPGSLVARSQSGQFCVWAALPGRAAPHLSNLETNQNLARLDASILPTSCERIKQMVWRELGATAPWRGSITLMLVPAFSNEDPITIASEQFVDRWRYRVVLPELVDRTCYVRAIVQVLLLEIANRRPGARSVEIPPWLLEGLTRELLVSGTRDELIPPPPQPTSDIMRPPASFTIVDSRRENPLGEAHQKLTIAPPLSFQELSWPSPEQWGPTVSDVFRDSAQLFVDRLLALKNGRGCLLAMIQLLPEHYNWQFAFLQAFNSHFQRPLDVEKWWTLQVVHFTGRDLDQTWPREESWQKFDESIRSQVQIRFGTNDLPAHAEVSLQTIVGEWDSAHQTQALQAKAHELDLLRLRIAPEFVPLLDEYRKVISTYLQSREHSGPVLPFRKKAAVRQLADETVQQLSALDRQRLALRPPTQKPEDTGAKPENNLKDPTAAFPSQARSDR